MSKSSQAIATKLDCLWSHGDGDFATAGTVDSCLYCLQGISSRRHQTSPGYRERRRRPLDTYCHCAHYWDCYSPSFSPEYQFCYFLTNLASSPSPAPNSIFKPPRYVEVMQPFLSRASIPAAATCRCISCTAAGAPNVVASRSSTAAARRLYAGNAVTMFYSTIFAAAVWLDVGAKHKHATEWKNQLEGIRAEMVELQIEEERLLAALDRRHRIRRLPLPMQKRGYSTASYASRPAREHERGLDESYRRIKSDVSRNAPESIADVVDFNLVEQEPGNVFANDPFWGNTDYSTSDALREGAIRRLATRQLAIKLLLRPRIAHSYGSVPVTDGSLFRLPKTGTSELLTELEAIKQRILALRFQKREPYGDIIHDLGLQRQEDLFREREALHKDLIRKFDRFDHGEIGLAELILSVSRNLLCSEEPISSQSVELLITQFSRARQNDIVRMILETILPNKFTITLPIIVSTINFFNKTRDLFGFDGFMRFLQGFGSPIKMPLPWQNVRVGDTDVALPTKPRHPYVMNALVSAALSFEQPARAAAWLHLLRETGYNEGPEVLGSYLRFYSVTPNWARGRHILLRSVAYLMSTTTHSESAAERLVLYMIVLCNCCGQHELASTLVRAAADARLDWFSCFNKRDLRLSVRLAMKQWQIALDEAQHAAAAGLKKAGAGVTPPPIGVRCYQFAAAVEPAIRQAAQEDIGLAPKSGAAVQATKEESKCADTGKANAAAETETNAGTEPSPLVDTWHEGIGDEKDRDDRNQRSFHLRYAGQVLLDAQSRAQPPAESTTPTKMGTSKVVGVDTRKEGPGLGLNIDFELDPDSKHRRRVDYLFYALQISGMTVADLRVEVDIAGRRVQLREMRQQLDELYHGVAV